MADQGVAPDLPEGLAKLMLMGGLPTLINHQDNLLTVNINEEEAIPNPLDGTVINPLFLDAENGVWVLYVSFKPGTLLPKHFHTGTVHFFTTKGAWHYVEYPDDKQTAGSYLYEPGGSIHTFTVPESATENAEGFMVVHGANVNFDDVNTMDAGWIEQLLHELTKASGQKMPRYIKPKSGAGYSDQ